MGFWHTGYIDFHEPTGLPEFAYTPSQRRFVCEFCEDSFDNLEKCRQHQFESHRIYQPTLYLYGKSNGWMQAVLLTPLCKEDVAITNTDYCTVDGQRMSVERLVSFLTEQSNRFVTLELHNHGATSRFELDFQIACTADLAGVERAFIDIVNFKSLSPSEVSAFNSTCRSFSSALRYCDGIAQFLYGMLAKESHPDCNLGYSEYVERFNRASEALKVVNRPLSLSIRAVIAFHLNQFDEAESLAPYGGLQEAAGVFSSLIRGFPMPRKQVTLDTTRVSQPIMLGASKNMMPDVFTQRLIDWTLLGSDLLAKKTDDLLKQLESGQISDYDRLKLMVLVCESTAQTDEPAKRPLASLYAGELCNSPALQTWWNQYQSRLNP